MGRAPLPSRRDVLIRAAGALAGAGSVGAIMGGTGAQAAPSAATRPLDEAAAGALRQLPGKAILGASGVPSLVTELVDYNAADWRRSALDMRELMAGDLGLAYTIVQAPRFDVRSLEAARVSLAVLASAPVQFEPFYLALAQGSGPVDGPAALAAAGGIGLDRIVVFNGSIVPEVTASLTKAAAFAAMIGLFDTPAYVIGGTVYEGYLDLDRKRALIAAARK